MPKNKPAWRECKPLLISDEDIADLMHLAKIAAEDFATTDRWRSLAQAIRAECPVPGDTWHKLFAVWKAVGGEVADHQHREHVMLFYPNACDPILIEGELFHPEAGTVLHIDPWTHHSVPSITAERLTIAMLVKDAEHPSPE